MAAQNHAKPSATNASGSGSSSNNTTSIGTSNTRSASTPAAAAAIDHGNTVQIQQPSSTNITHAIQGMRYTSLIGLNGTMYLDLPGTGAQFPARPSSVAANAGDFEE